MFLLVWTIMFRPPCFCQFKQVLERFNCQSSTSIWNLRMTKSGDTVLPEKLTPFFPLIFLLHPILFVCHLFKWKWSNLNLESSPPNIASVQKYWHSTGSNSEQLLPLKGPNDRWLHKLCLQFKTSLILKAHSLLESLALLWPPISSTVMNN